MRPPLTQKTPLNLSESELALFDGRGSAAIYVAVDGDVFDGRLSCAGADIE